uniref:Uncharacterized protein n=1 Tax=Gasterosteus aculeatus TaxID=69293 RepID=G3QBP4_GASAC
MRSGAIGWLSKGLQLWKMELNICNSSEPHTQPNKQTCPYSVTTHTNTQLRGLVCCPWVEARVCIFLTVCVSIYIIYIYIYIYILYYILVSCFG